MIVNVQKKWFFFFFIIIIFPSSIEAQVIKGKQNRLRSEQAIVDLREGALVVRLKSKRNKIEKLEEAIANPELDEKERNRLKKELDETTMEKEEYNAGLSDAFVNYYTFSAIYFMYDTSSVALKNGVKSGFLLDKDLKVDPNITIGEDSIFVIYNGELDATNSSGMEALIIMDGNFNILQSPFPYYIRSNNFWWTLGRFFSPKQAIKRDSKKIVTKLDYNLNEYYEKITSKP
jgi:hypothetical protein